MRRLLISLVAALAIASPAAADNVLDGKPDVWVVLAAAGNHCPAGTVSDLTALYLMDAATRALPDADIGDLADALDLAGGEFMRKAVAQGTQIQVCMAAARLSRSMDKN